MDPRTEAAIASLLPSVQARFRTFYATANAAMKSHGLSVQFVSGTRSYAEQTALYAQGRTKPGRIVTNAKAGFSNHNFGVAVDVAVFKGKAWLPESPAYAWLGPIGEAAGLKWGGRWTVPDRPHYEYPTGLTLAEMRARAASGKSVLNA